MQGEPSAQYNLGVICEMGWGAPQSFPEADAAGRAAAVDNRNAVAAKMTPDEIGRAKELAAAWKAK